MKSEQTNLNKYISSSGFCSRRDADKLIEQARVTVNGELMLPGAKVSAGDVVEVDGEPIKSGKKKRPIYMAFHKPVGVTSTTDVHDKANIIYFINHPKRIFPIGRLDKDSDGLIFLTNDGDIVNKILRASNNHEKEYIVNVDKAVTPDFIAKMSNGIPVLGKVTKKCFVRQEGSRRFRIILTQGLNRQIRRMCEYLGYGVISLSRVRIMNVELGNLPEGKWRYLTLPEIEQMNVLVATSVKTEEASKPAKQYIPKNKKSTPADEDYSMPDRPAKEGKERKGRPARAEGDDELARPAARSRSAKTEGADERPRRAPSSRSKTEGGDERPRRVPSSRSAKAEGGDERPRRATSSRPAKAGGDRDKAARKAAPEKRTAPSTVRVGDLPSRPSKSSGKERKAAPARKGASRPGAAAPGKSVAREGKAKVKPAATKKKRF